MAAAVIRHDPDTYVECRLLIAHPDRPRGLAVRNARSWSLPVLTPFEHHPSAVGHINDAVNRLYGLRTFVRRMVSEQVDESPYRAIRRLYELEVVSELGRQRIARTAWTGRTVLDEMEFGDESDRRAIETWIGEYGSEEPEPAAGTGTTPWMRAGWFEIASAWMRRNATGSDGIGKTVPHQHWTDGEMMVLSAESTAGLTMLIVAKSGSEPDADSIGAQFGWQHPELITKDDVRHWSLYRTSDRTANLPVNSV